MLFWQLGIDLKHTSHSLEWSTAKGSYFIDEVAALLNPLLASPVSFLFDASVQVVVKLWVAKVHVCLLNKRGNLFKLIVGVVLVVLDDSAEDLSQVRVKVVFDCAVAALRVKMILDALQRFRIDDTLHLLSYYLN